MSGVANGGDDLKLTKLDSWLLPYSDQLDQRAAYMKQKTEHMLAGKSLQDFATGHLYYGLHKTIGGGWVFREWAPNATKIFLICEATNWKDHPIYELKKLLGSDGDWELKLPDRTLKHLDHYKLHVYWPDGDGERLPSYADYITQDPETLIYDAVVWSPKERYQWQNPSRMTQPDVEFIYEAHVGMAGENPGVSTYSYFRQNILPRIANLGYTTVQLMAIQEHPYYGSFGYQVANFFAPSSRFGTPDDLRQLIDDAHGMGLRVILDVVHSHSVKNDAEGLGNFSGQRTQYFYDHEHPAWGSLVFDYGKNQVNHFLLSNLRYWLDEFKFDGFRFDGVTSMLYRNHGINASFGSYGDYFGDNINLDALNYLRLANQLTHQISSVATTIAEDVSGMPGLAANIDDSCVGFDYRFNMGVPDLWIKMIKDQPEESWSMGELLHQLTSHRPEEKTINYAESHDQALVGDKTLIFRLIDKEMYSKMSINSQSLVVDRGVALHKMIRLITAATNDGGYLNFMGNEFGHPEWIDFPREGNGWSYNYARRQWSLSDNVHLRYHQLNVFDRDMLRAIKSVGLDEIIYKHTDDDKKIISFVRGNRLFVFNFSNNSYEALRVPARPKSYRIVLSTDNSQFGGFDRVDERMDYHGKHDDVGTFVNLYLPARTALVLESQYHSLKSSPWGK